MVEYSFLTKLYTNKLQPDIPDNIETLQGFYVEPNFNIYKNSIYKRDSSENNAFYETSNSDESIHKFINEYFLKGIKYDDCVKTANMLFILGQPGQGKTSLCYRILFDYITSNQGIPVIPIFFVKIRDLVAKDFIDNPFETIKNKLKFGIDYSYQEGILILDGLDEAYMSGGLKDTDLRNLYDRLNKATQHNPKLKIILTSRFNYLNVQDSCIDGSLVIEIRKFNDYQILEYTTKFGVIYPENKFIKKIDEILTIEEYSHIKELLQQAVLIYFIAFSDIDIEEKDSKSKIYDKIFNSLAERSWDKNGQLSYINSNLKNNPSNYKKHLREFIRNIAFEIYQSENLYITLDEIIELDSTKKFIKKCFDISLNNSEINLKDISKYLMISFYFQETKNKENSDTAIEFFHNSLWEFLTAEYIWEELKKMFFRKDSDGDYITTKVEECYDLISDFVGNKELNDEIIINLFEIIEIEKSEIKSNFNSLFLPIFHKLSHYDFLLKYDSKISNLTPFEKSIYIFLISWLCATKSNEEIKTKIKLAGNSCSQIFDIDEMFFTPKLFELKNIYLENFKFNKGLEEYKFFNTNFLASSFNNCIFFDNKFTKCCFSDIFIYNFSFIANIFVDVIFEEFSSYTSFEVFNNNFKNCTFLNFRIPSEIWFEDFIENNIFDSITLNNIKLNQVLEADHDEKEEIVNYINYSR